MSSEIGHYMEACGRLRTENADLKAKLEIATEGLRHYADKTIWEVADEKQPTTQDWYFGTSDDGADLNGYDIAADCLKRIEGEK